jgi:hypothetical protein
MYIDGFRIGDFGKNPQDSEKIAASAKRNLDRWMTDNPGWRNLDDTQPGPRPHDCLHWLAGQRRCILGTNSAEERARKLQQEARIYGERPYFGQAGEFCLGILVQEAGPFDHYQMFTHKNGRRLMIAHPYSMSDNDAATLKALTNTLPLAWRDAGKEHDWYYPGSAHTVFVATPKTLESIT